MSVVGFDPIKTYHHAFSYHYSFRYHTSLVHVCLMVWTIFYHGC
nr:MAG TPA: hypothetical protein [Caudoviricetes sp.]